MPRKGEVHSWGTTLTNQECESVLNGVQGKLKPGSTPLELASIQVWTGANGRLEGAKACKVGLTAMNSRYKVLSNTLHGWYSERWGVFFPQSTNLCSLGFINDHYIATLG